MSFLNTRNRRLFLVIGLVWAVVGATLAYIQTVRLAELARDSKLVACTTYTQISVCPVFAQLAYDKTIATYWYLAATYILVPAILAFLAVKIRAWVVKGS